MRILLFLKPLQDYQINFEYHRKIQGFIYSFLRNSSFNQLHDKKGYKFFCFSNIFKSSNSKYFLIISSPNKELLDHIYEQLNKIAGNHTPIYIGSLFRLTKVTKIPERNLIFPLKIVTQSPIIIRIPLKKYHGNTIHDALYRSVFWRSGHPIDLFVNALESNMRKKYAEFTGLQVKRQIFEQYEFKKQVSTKIEQKVSKIPVIGSLWEIVFSPRISSDVQKFVLDCGLGERNSLGFGFVNPITKK